MVTIVKHEWHQVDRQYTFELDEDILTEIYPDMDEDEIADLIKQLESGEADIEEIIDEAWNSDVEIEWDFQYDDCWTDRKGGYEVTYEYGDEDSYHHAPEDTPPTHKCTKCRWEGKSYQTLTQYLREDGTVIEDYYSTDEESHSTKDSCPMCDSDIELTEEGVKDEKERQEREARWAAIDIDNKSLAEVFGDEAECFSCGKLVSADELIELDGQEHCPHCKEGWVNQV
jgi:Zn finger protein HypA/HybF involved in hydrogenase expression